MTGFKLPRPTKYPRSPPRAGFLVSGHPQMNLHSITPVDACQKQLKSKPAPRRHPKTQTMEMIEDGSEDEPAAREFGVE